MWNMKIGLVPLILAISLLPVDLVRADSFAVKNLVPDTFGDGEQPQVTVTPAGVVVVAFAHDQSIYSVVSADEGKSFSTPVKIAEVAAIQRK